VANTHIHRECMQKAPQFIKLTRIWPKEKHRRSLRDGDGKRTQGVWVLDDGHKY